MQNSQNSSFNSSKGRSPGDRSSPSTPSDSARGAPPTGDGAPSGADSNNQQDWTFEEQFKQVKSKIIFERERFGISEPKKTVGVVLIYLEPHKSTLRSHQRIYI